MYLIKPKKEKIIKVKEPDIKVGCTFQVEKFRSDGTITYKGPEFNNTMLNVGLDGLFTFSINEMMCYCNVGEGTDVPDITQTGLGSIAGTSPYNGYSSVDIYGSDPLPTHYILERKFTFPVGTCTGNITEVGLSKDANSSYFNRQLLKDMYDAPTTITVASDEGMRVTASVCLYADMEEGTTVSGSFNTTISGTPTEIYYGKEMNHTGSYGFLNHNDSHFREQQRITYMRKSHFDVTISSSYEGFTRATTPSSSSTQSYVPGSFERVRDNTWEAGRFVGDIQSIRTGFFIQNDYQLYHYLYAFRLDTPITLTDTDEFTLTAKTTWGRYSP